MKFKEAIFHPAYYLSLVRDRINSFIFCRVLKCRNCQFRYPISKLRGEKSFKIGDNTVFQRYSILTAFRRYGSDQHTPEVSIGEGCNFGDYLHLSCINKISIGKRVLTGRWVTINDNSHGLVDGKSLITPPLLRPLVSKGPIIIEDNVWIGDKATILGGVTIGEGSVIGANSVVTHDIPPYSVAAGMPAKVIKTLSPDASYP